MKYDINNPDDSFRDRLIVGKGHACLGIYNILADLGFIDTKLLQDYDRDWETIVRIIDIIFHNTII